MAVQRGEGRKAIGIDISEEALEEAKRITILLGKIRHERKMSRMPELLIIMRLINQRKKGRQRNQA